MKQSNHTIPGVFSLMWMVSHPGHSTRNMREDLLFSMGVGVYSPVSKMFNTIMFCVLLIVLCLWCYPSHGTGPREGAFNQLERWTNYWWWFQKKRFIEVPKLSTHLAQSQGYLVLWLGSQVNIVQGLLVTSSLVTVYLSPVWVLAQCCLLTLVFSI